jgi:betaine-aldehyde dehydrogenase
MTHSGPTKLGLVTHEPCGVVGMILPWNFPAMTLFQKLPFALAAGCASVIKPSEFTSGTALETAFLAEEAGVPKGMINIVTGTGPDVGEPLASHADIDMISFTGSSRVGKLIAHHAADVVKKVALELGGKGANIVFADADLEAAVEGALAGFTINQGEECCAGSRLLIEETIAQDFLNRLVERARQVKIGLPADEATEMGALIHEQHVERVLGYVEKGRREGARLLTGGERLTQGGLDKGCFVAPTIFAGVTPDMTIFREEIFGPVVSVVTFRTVEEAIRIANDTIYGLANGVWSRNVDKAMLVSRGIRSGTVYVNCYLETLPQLPFGGIRESGLGRENGIDGLLEFMHVKATFLKLAVP